MATDSIRLDPSLLEKLEGLARKRGKDLDGFVAELLEDSLSLQQPLAATPETAASEAETRLRREKTRFLSALVHELRTPLGSMLMLAELLTDNNSGSLSPRELKYAENLHQAASDVLQLISDVGFLNRIEAGRVEALVDAVPTAKLAGRIEEAFRPLAEEKGLAFDVQLAPGSPETIRTDRKLLERILQEVVGNAVQVSHRGAVAVRLGVSPTDAPEGRFLLTVQDTGAVLPDAEWEALFQPFTHTNPRSSRKFGGTGLGMAIARSLARLLGGDLCARTEAGVPTLNLELPLEGPPGALQHHRGSIARNSEVGAAR